MLICFLQRLNREKRQPQSRTVKGEMLARRQGAKETDREAQKEKYGGQVNRWKSGEYSALWTASPSEVFPVLKKKKKHDKLPLFCQKM